MPKKFNRIESHDTKLEELGFSSLFSLVSLAASDFMRTRQLFFWKLEIISFEYLKKPNSSSLVPRY